MSRMLRRVLSRWYGRLLLTVLLAVAAYGCWQLWCELRPPSVFRWGQAMAQARQAMLADDFPRAERHLRVALQDARKWGPAHYRLAETQMAWGAYYDAANAQRYADHILNTHRLPVPVWQLARKSGSGATRYLTALEEQRRKPYPTANADARYAAALRTFERAYGQHDPRLIPILERLARRDRAYGDWDVAKAQQQRAFALAQQAYGLADARTHAVYDGLLPFYITAEGGDHQLECHRQKLRVWEQACGTADPALIPVLLGLARQEALYGLHDADAETHIRRALALTAANYEPHSRQLLETQLQAARCYSAVRWGMAESCWYWKSIAAEQSYRHALAIAEKLDGRNSVVVARVCVEAIPFFRGSDSGGYALLGPRGVATANALEARARAILDAPACPRTAETAEVLLQLARHETSYDKFTEAERHLQRALNIEQRIAGKHSREVAIVYGDLARLAARQDRQKKSVQLLHRRTQLLRAICAPNDPMYLMACYEEGAHAFWSSGSHTGGDAGIHRQYLAALINGYGLQSPEVFFACNHMVQALEFDHPRTAAAIRHRAKAVGVVSPY